MLLSYSMVIAHKDPIQLSAAYNLVARAGADRYLLNPHIENLQTFNDNLSGFFKHSKAALHEAERVEDLDAAKEILGNFFSWFDETLLGDIPLTGASFYMERMHSMDTKLETALSDFLTEMEKFGETLQNIFSDLAQQTAEKLTQTAGLNQVAKRSAQIRADQLKLIYDPQARLDRTTLSKK